MGGKFSEYKDNQPYMSQNVMLQDIERFLGKVLTTQTIRRWEKDGVISKPFAANTGPCSNIQAFKLYMCGEVYAAVSLSFGIYDLYHIPTDIAPKINLSTIAHLRAFAYIGKQAEYSMLTIPYQDKIEEEIGYSLPDMSGFEDLNFKRDFRLDDLFRYRMDDYFNGCLASYKKILAKGMILFGKSQNLIRVKGDLF